MATAMEARTGTKKSRKFPKWIRFRPTEMGGVCPQIWATQQWWDWENASVATNDRQPVTPASTPAAPLFRAVCSKCKKASSHLHTKTPPGNVCASCLEDACALFTLAVQEECGVNLGLHQPNSGERVTRSEAEAFGVHLQKVRRR